MKEPAAWVPAKYGRRFDREKVPLVQYSGELPEALEQYFARSSEKLIYDEIYKGVKHIIGGYGKDQVEPDEFARTLSLGNYELPSPPEQEWKCPRDAWYVEDTLENSDVIVREERKSQEAINSTLRRVEDYLRIWNTCADPYGLKVNTEDLFSYKEDRVLEMARFIGADSAIAAYAAGVGIDDVLA